MKILKKSIVVILSFALLFATSCLNVKDTPQKHVSQIRTDIFFGESDEISAFVYAEKRESPFLSDNHTGELKTCLVIRIPLQAEKLSCNVSYLNNSYDCVLTYDNVTSCLTATVQVNKLPDKSISLSFNDKTLILNSMLKSDSITPKQALNHVIKAEQKFVSSLYSGDKFNAEVYIRLLFEGEYNYYYVGFAQSDKITAFLLDAKNGEIIAGRTSA